MKEKYYKVSEVAKIFSVSKQTIYKAIKNNKIKASYIDETVRIPEKEIERLKKGE